jgi:hypothetical protein
MLVLGGALQGETSIGEDFKFSIEKRGDLFPTMSLKKRYFEGRIDFNSVKLSEP